MIINKKQLFRLTRLVGELKENRYPNATTFTKRLKDADIDSNLDISCSIKTFGRDIKLLKEHYGAPIEYCYDRKGYFLKHHGWNFDLPLYSEEELTASILGSRIAEDFVPEPLKSEIRRAVDLQLNSDNPELLENAEIETFKSFAGLKVSIKSNIYSALYSGWKNRQSVTIHYKKLFDETTTERLIDPYFLVYASRGWYIKGYCHLRKDIRTFAVHKLYRKNIC